MHAQEPLRNGSFTDTDLAADCDERATNLEENLEALLDEGLTADMIKVFRTEILAFRQLPTEITLSNDVSAAIILRDKALEAARSGLRQASQPIRRAFGDESKEYRSFGVGEVSRKTVSEVLNLLLTVPGIGTLYLTNAQAIAEGFTKKRLDALLPLYTTLFKAEEVAHKIDLAAQLGTRTRVLAYNALNTKCSLYCAKGYDHFVELDEKLASLFVRHPASHPAPVPTPPVPPVG